MPKQSDSSLAKTVAFRVTADDYDVIARAMRQERRIESDVCRALLGRGLAAYKRDGEIFEPEHRRVPVINETPARKRTGGEQRKTGTENR